MERTVPRTASEEVELYIRTIYSLLRSTTEVQIRTLEEVHAGMHSSLHPNARQIAPDISAFIYSLLRLPAIMPKVSSVILGQSLSVFRQHGFADIEQWEPVSQKARRRRCFFNGRDVLACYISSRTDIDDIIPTLTAYQIEWNKLHLLLQHAPANLIRDAEEDQQAFLALSEILEIPADDLERLRLIWADEFVPMLTAISRKNTSLRVRLLSGSLSEYWRATRTWWEKIETVFPQLREKPVYFISSNTHSVTNLLSGFAKDRREELIAYIQSGEHTDLLEAWGAILSGETPSSEENFLYYVLKKLQQTPEGKPLVEAQLKWEMDHGITRIPSDLAVNVEAQVIELSKLDPRFFDPRLPSIPSALLQNSDALILNIDYPLGLTAYNILTKIAEYVSPVLGIYIMGKAATLNGVSGDVMIPAVVQDEHSLNTYLFQNAFTAADVSPYLVYGTVLDNQKGVSVLGTFLQNDRLMDVFYREGYTDIEMEAGPYLSAIYEMYRPQRHPVNEIVNLYGVPFDLGILHYASDTPFGKGRNLGAGTLSYYGMDSTYASTIAILHRILQRERQRLEPR